MRSTHMPASISKNRYSGIQAAAGFLFRRQGRLESRRLTLRPVSGNSRNPLLGGHRRLRPERWRKPAGREAVTHLFRVC